MEANRERDQHLHFFFTLLRSLEHTWQRQMLDLGEYFTGGCGSFSLRRSTLLVPAAL
jgi:hypothetical protein